MSEREPDEYLSGSCSYALFGKFMQSKILNRSLFVVSILVIASSSLIIFFLTPELPARDSYTKTASSIDNTSVYPVVSAEQARFELPIRLRVPKIDVDAPVEYVGLTVDGAMDVPKERANVAWFSIGPRPGESGTAIIAGHYGWKDKKASVFDNLYKLRKGDTLYVEDGEGTILSFVVRESRRYDPNTDAPEVFTSNDGKSHLNLITCEGAWDEALKSYTKRLVVFADKE